MVERLKSRVVLQFKSARLPTKDFLDNEIESLLRLQEIGSNLAAEVVTALPTLVFVALHARFNKLAIVFVEHVLWQGTLSNHLQLNM